MNIIRPVDYEEAVKIAEEGGIVYAIALAGWDDSSEGCVDVFQYVELTPKNLSSMAKTIDDLKDENWFVLAKEFHDIMAGDIDLEGGKVLFTWRCPKKLRNVSEMVRLLSSME